MVSICQWIRILSSYYLFPIEVYCYAEYIRRNDFRKDVLPECSPTKKELVKLNQSRINKGNMYHLKAHRDHPRVEIMAAPILGMFLISTRTINLT